MKQINTRIRQLGNSPGLTFPQTLWTDSTQNLKVGNQVRVRIIKNGLEISKIEENKEEKQA